MKAFSKMRYRGIVLISVIMVSIIIYSCQNQTEKSSKAVSKEIPWKAPDISKLPADSSSLQIKYGKDLIVHTSKYFGPKGSIATISNGMECQNCHLDAGTRPFGNSFGAVFSTYPKYRARSGRVESIEYRINECMERSMNGKKIDTLSKEMKAMKAYLTWLGKDVPKGVKPAGTGIQEIAFINRAANPQKGKAIYLDKCQSCHGINGQGLIKPDSSGYLYPPLWGSESYNVSAGMYRISRFAGFVKHNMPFTAVKTNPQLTDEEAWDLAAFVNSQQRTEKFFSYDWKKISAKPVDYPFGPYADSYTEKQHKYGPFKEMKKPESKSAR
ncbi:MAG: cytochrome c class [Sphingobacteriales bacterium]|nr:cytochrome c class [Sphingobacteriales bacterium]